MLSDGFETMTITTNLGVIEALLDLSKAHCAAASFKYLGEQKFLDDSACHRLDPTVKTLTCGYPKNSGTGGPAYQFADEDVPTQPLPAASPSPGASAPAGATYYAKGTIVLDNTGANTNGSQFSIVYATGAPFRPTYSVVGTVTKGLDLVETVARAGAAPDGKPTKPLIVQGLTVALPAAPTTAPATATGTTAPPRRPRKIPWPAGHPQATDT